MKVIYILSSAHSGSTILDLILGSHESFISSGEQRYLPWNLERTMESGGSLEEESVCSCLRSFRECNYWKSVLNRVEDKSGVAVIDQPRLFPISFFGKFGYKNLGSLDQRVLGKLCRHLLQLGLFPKVLLKTWTALRTVLDNNWCLYESMCEVGGRSCVVDSSKDITRALLLQLDRPNDVVFLFLSRNPFGYVNSMINRGRSLEGAVESQLRYKKRSEQTIKHVANLRYLETTYERFVDDPCAFLREMSEYLGLPKTIDKRMREKRLLDTRERHMVAGNPTRFRGEMRIELDEKWRRSLSEDQVGRIRRLVEER